MKKTVVTIAAVVLIQCTWAADTAGLGGADYQSNQVRGIQTVRFGRIISVHDANIQAQPAGGGFLAPMAGAVIGGLAGQSVGQGNGTLLATAVGAVGGALAGQHIQDRGAAVQGIQLTIKLDDTGQLLAVTQAADESFAPGDQVQVLSGAGAIRVTHR